MRYAIRHINDLPSIEELRKRSQGLALVDAIIMPEWEYRYFSFNCNWDGSGKEMMASMRDGSGCEYFVYFSKCGVAGKVLSSEYLIDASQSLRDVPDCFSAFKAEPAFNLEKATFFFWREEKEPKWMTSPNNLNDYPLLEFVAYGVTKYCKWAETYYERSIDADVLEQVFTSLKVTERQLHILNPELSSEDLKEDIHEIVGAD